MMGRFMSAMAALLLVLAAGGAWAQEPTFELTCENVVAITVSPRGEDFGVLVQFTPEMTQEFKKFTSEHIDEKIFLTAKGEPIFGATVREPIETGGIAFNYRDEQEAMHSATAICKEKVVKKDLSKQ